MLLFVLLFSFFFEIFLFALKYLSKGSCFSMKWMRLELVLEEVDELWGWAVNDDGDDDEVVCLSYDSNNNYDDFDYLQFAFVSKNWRIDGRPDFDRSLLLLFILPLYDSNENYIFIYECVFLFIFQNYFYNNFHYYLSFSN